MKAPEQERRDWFLVPLLLGLGFLCVILAGQWALRFSPRWTLHADMGSNLDPNSDSLTRRPNGLIEPVDPAILTEPVWINLFLTPGAEFSTQTLIPATASEALTTPTTAETPVKTSTSAIILFATNTQIVMASSTSTLVLSPPPSTFRPKATATSIDTPTPTVAIPSSWTSTATQTPMQSLTRTSTPTFTATATPTSTPTATPSPTKTPDPSEPDFGAPDGNGTTLGNGASVLFHLSGFSLDGNSSWDMVYYEMEEASAAGKIHLGAVQIEVYDQTTGSWYRVYDWGDGLPDMNASYNNGNSEPDGFPVDKSLLYGAAPLNTGIALDVDAPALAQGGSVGDSITQIRITSLSGTKCNIDAIQMLR